MLSTLLMLEPYDVKVFCLINLLIFSFSFLQAPVAKALAELIHCTVDPVYHKHSGLLARLRPKVHSPPSTKAPPQVIFCGCIM
jgi:hypothetical protein